MYIYVYISRVENYKTDPINERILNQRDIANEPPLSIQSSTNYVIVDINQLNKIFIGLVCPVCQKSELEVTLHDKKEGFVQKLILHCQNCEDIGLDPEKKSVNTSERVDPDSNNHSSFDLNIRMSSAFIYMGLGYAAVEQFGMFLNIPVICKTVFDEHVNKIHKASMTVVHKCLQSARSLTKLLLEELLNTEDSTFVNSTVSFDGSWLTRGHKSKFGFASVIDFTSGYVLDFEILSKHCQECTSAKNRLGKNTKKFTDWFAATKIIVS